MEDGINEPKTEFPVRRLLKQGDVVVGYPAFGPNWYSNNLQEMQKSYSHPLTGEKITFREPTTRESIVAAAYNFAELAKPQIFDPRWLQAGRIVRTSDGVYANVPKDNQGKPITDTDTLKAMLKDTNKVKVKNGHIYLGKNDFGFAEYSTFEQGKQDCDTFAESGLGRVLEHTEGPAQKLRVIASPKHYKRGVNVVYFEPVKEPVVRVVSLGSGGGILGDRLFVDGGWDDNYGGFAFGGLSSAEGTAQKSK